MPQTKKSQTRKPATVEPDLKKSRRAIGRLFGPAAEIVKCKNGYAAVIYMGQGKRPWHAVMAAEGSAAEMAFHVAKDLMRAHYGNSIPTISERRPRRKSTR